MTKGRLTLLLLSAVVAGGVAGRLQAQSALGGGNVLDANLNPTSGRSNSAILRGQNALGSGSSLDANLNALSGPLNTASPQAGFANRNAIITGNVAGGRGFRGSVGYSAPGDFQGRLGSNDLFRFRADSAYSSPALFKLGTTFEQLRFGQGAGALEYNPAFSRDPGVQRSQLPVSSQQILPERFGLDRSSFSGSISSEVQGAADARIIGMGYDPQKTPLVYSASPIRGVTAEPMSQYVGLLGLSPYDSARVRQDVESGMPPPQLGAPFRGPLDEMRAPATGMQQPESAERPGMLNDEAKLDPRIDSRIDSSAPPVRMDGSLAPDYTEAVQRITDRYAKSKNVDAKIEPELIKNLGNDYEQLRDRLRKGADIDELNPSDVGRGGIQSRRTNAAKPTEKDELGQRERIKEMQDGTEPGPDSTEGVAPPSAIGKGTTEMPIMVPRPPQASDFAGALRHGKRFERLSGAGQDRFNELMSSAEQMLAKGEYFTAERRFDRALRFVPGHPLALVGMGHAQLGGGLYLSASLTLRKLLIDQPELIDATYAANLLPATERLDEAVKELQEQLANPTDRFDRAFLLAYIGHLRGDRKLIAQGLDAMAVEEPQDTLQPLLREVWLSDDAAKNAATQPVEPPVNPEK